MKNCCCVSVFYFAAQLCVSWLRLIDWMAVSKSLVVIWEMMKSVVFDLDGTLLDRDASVEQFVSVQYV